jgi:hypothetical protein
MTKSIDTSSTKSSALSRKAASIKKTVQKGAKAIARPFKKLKTAVSNASTSRSQSTTTLPISNADPDNGSDRSSTDEEPQVELGPKEQLGKH